MNSEETKIALTVFKWLDSPAASDFIEWYDSTQRESNWKDLPLTKELIRDNLKTFALCWRSAYWKTGRRLQPIHRALTELLTHP